MNKTYQKYRTAAICIFLVAATVLVYWRVLFNDFVNFDDDIYVTENEHVITGLSGRNVVWAFSSSEVSYWHPVTWLSHILDCQFYGLRAGLHHLSSLILHILNSLLLFAVLRRMTGAIWRSALVAALFALHPLNVDSVAWVAERKSVLSTLFWLLTMWAYAGYARNKIAGQYVLSLVFFALGLMAKPMLVTLPFVMLVLDYWPLKRFECGETGGKSSLSTNWVRCIYRLVPEKIPFLVLSAVAVILFGSWGVREQSAVSAELMPMKLRAANALVSYVKYIAKAFWPAKLAVYYPFPDSVPMWEAAGAMLLIVCISCVAIAQLKRRPYLATGWLWYVGTLVPVIGLYQAGLWPAMADRWAYVPLIGVFIIVAWGVGELSTGRFLRNYVVVPAAGASILALMVCTWFQVGYWRNGSALFGRALEVTSDNFIAHV